MKRNEHQCSIRNCFNFFLFLREGVNLFHLIDDDELTFFLSYLMKWVIVWCSLMELLLRKSLVFGLSFILFRKL